MPVTGARRGPRLRLRLRLRSGLWLPLFDDLADPGVVARLAGEAEEVGWHGAVAEAGVTWWLPEFDPATVSLDQVRGVLRDGPATP